MSVPESISVTDNRTGESIEIPIRDGGVDAREWRKLLPDVFFFDPAFIATATCESSITEVDGDAGILRYRGYPIDQLAEHSTYLEVAYLVRHGELPTNEQLETWRHEVTYHTFIHENMRKRFIEGFHYDAHPMGIFTSAVAALSTFYPEAKDIRDPEIRHKQVVRLVAKMPTLAASAYRFFVGMPFVYPNNSLDYTANFLNMMFSAARAHPLRRPGDGPGARHPLHPARRPRAELLDHRGTGGRQLRRRPLHLLRRRAWPRSTGRGTAAPTRPWCACSPRSARSRTSPTSSSRSRSRRPG